MFYSVQNQCTDGSLASCASGQSTTYIISDTCAGTHASLGICVWDTRYPGKHAYLQHRYACMCTCRNCKSATPFFGSRRSMAKGT